MVTTDERTAVVDAGPLIHLNELGCLDLLADLSPVIAPDVVWGEARKHRPCLTTSWIPGLKVVPMALAPSARLAVLVDSLGLDIGETEALALAEKYGLRMFLTDDSAARLAAESLGLRAHGTIGIVLRSIRRGLRSRREVLDILASIHERSTLHLAKGLLAEVVAKVTQFDREV